MGLGEVRLEIRRPSSVCSRSVCKKLGNFTMMSSISTRRTPRRAAGNSAGTDGDGGAGTDGDGGAGRDDGAGIDGDRVRGAGEGTGETRTGDGATPALTARRDATETAGPEEDDGAAA